MDDNVKDIKAIRIILLPPEKTFIGQFSNKKQKRKIVLSRRNNPFVIALNEWPNNIVLKWILFIPLFILLLITAIPVFLFAILIYFFSKQLSDAVFQKYSKLLDSLAVHNNEPIIEESIRDYIMEFKNPISELPFRRILYVSESEKNFILKFNQSKVFDFIDEIWLYDSMDELYDRCLKQNFDLDKSYIASSINASENNNQESDLHEFIDITWLDDNNINIINAKKRKIDKEIRIVNSQKPRAPRIKLKANNFLNPQIVYYYESTYDIELNDYLLSNFDRINDALIAKGMCFLYMPRFLKPNDIINENLIQYSSYVFPEIFNRNVNDKLTLINSILESLDTAELNSSIKLALAIPELDYPCFLHCVDYDNSLWENRTFEYSIFNLRQEDGSTIEAKIDYYLQAVNISRNNAQYRLVEIDTDDPDDCFNRIGNNVTDELNKTIAAINSLDSEKLVIASLIYIIKNLKDTQPMVCEKLNRVLFDAISNTNQLLSRILIDKRYRIFLSDYNNLEIELSPLPKTLFIFLLRHPEGVILKELYLHRKELIDIYGEIGNRLDKSVIQKSIYEMTSAKSNSINEKCSRIKEAFVAKVADHIACNYYITGLKSEPKKIILDRSLVTFL